MNNQHNANADRATLEQIVRMMEQNKVEGLNWPGVAKLIRKVLNMKGETIQ